MGGEMLYYSNITYTYVTLGHRCKNKTTDNICVFKPGKNVSLNINRWIMIMLRIYRS